MLDAGSLATRGLDVTVPPHPVLDLQTPAATVECWIWPESTAEWPRLLSKYNHGVGEEGRGWELMPGDEGRVVFRLARPGTDLHVQSVDAVPAKRWTRVRCGFDGPGKPIQIWLGDTLSVRGQAAAFNPRVVPVPLTLGRYAGGGRPFQGRLCGVRIWDCGPEPLPDAGGRDPVFALRIGSDGGQAVVTAATPEGLPVLILGKRMDKIGPGPDGAMTALLFGNP